MNPTFEDLKHALRKRTQEDFSKCEDWSLNDWMVALTGEVGELANFFKKIRRGDLSFEDPDVCIEIGHEFGDIFAYLIILADKAGYGLLQVSADKFNIVSERMNSEIKI